MPNKNASHALGHERRKNTSRFHSRLSLGAACDEGHAEGIHIPRAHGRTFCPQRVRGLAAGDPLSLSPWDGHTLSDRRAVHLRCLLYQSFASVSSHPPRISPLENNTQAAVFIFVYTGLRCSMHTPTHTASVLRIRQQRWNALQHSPAVAIHRTVHRFIPIYRILYA